MDSESQLRFRGEWIRVRPKKLEIVPQSFPGSVRRIILSSTYRVVAQLIAAGELAGGTA